MLVTNNRQYCRLRPQRARFLGTGASHIRESGDTGDFAEFVSELEKWLTR